jgi:hypothetical protein
VSEADTASAFLDKWLGRWPEWSVAEAFVAAAQRTHSRAWFALRQELLDAAWAGDDPRPGEAKLAWWMEELHGWSLGRRRHPLGVILQPVSAPWSELAKATASLPATRDPVGNAGLAREMMLPFATAIVAVDAAMAGLPQQGTDVEIACLLCDQILSRGDAAAPLQVRAALGPTPPEAAPSRAWASEVLRAWPSVMTGSRATRVLAALKRERLERFVHGCPLARPIPRWSVLLTAWKGARG